AGGQGGQGKDTITEYHLHVDALTHREVERLDVVGTDRETVDVGDGHAVATESHLEDGVSARVDEHQACFIPRSGIKRSVRPGNASFDEVVRIHDITGISARAGSGVPWAIMPPSPPISIPPWPPMSMFSCPPMSIPVNMVS